MCVYYPSPSHLGSLEKTAPPRPTWSTRNPYNSSRCQLSGTQVSRRVKMSARVGLVSTRSRCGRGKARSLRPGSRIAASCRSIATCRPPQRSPGSPCRRSRTRRCTGHGNPRPRAGGPLHSRRPRDSPTAPRLPGTRSRSATGAAATGAAMGSAHRRLGLRRATNDVTACERAGGIGCGASR